jgi:hypothetical protein
MFRTIESMSEDLERVRRGFEKAQEFAGTYRFEMTDAYRALIARVESMPRNQSGADKGDRWIGSQADRRAFFKAFTRAPRK